MSKYFLPLLVGSVSSIVFTSAVFAQVPTQIPNVAGNWKMSIPGKNRTMTYTLIQTGNTLTGILRGDRGKLPLKGTITKDNKITFSGKAWNVSLNFTGTVNGNTMKGVVDLPMGQGRQNWTATKSGIAGEITINH
jgi:hypothetical protein